jgi:hypothetical protein
VIYPFLYQVIDTIDAQEMLQGLVNLSRPVEVQKGWFYNPVKSDFLAQYIAKKFPGMVLYPDILNMSNSVGSGFHIDRLNYNFLAHRIIIPIDTHFHYEWYVNETLHRYRPKAGEVIVFNNHVPHRFVRDEGSSEQRRVILFSLIDEKAAPFMKHFTGASDYNSAQLDLEIRKKLGEDLGADQ